MKNLLFSLLVLITSISFSQKKILDHQDFEIWNTIKDPIISSSGNHVMYSIEKGETDNILNIKNTKGSLIFKYDRSEKGQFTYDSKYALFTINAWKDSISELKRRKVKKDEMPKDTLGIYSISDNSLIKIAHIKSYKIPEKWSGYVAYQLEEVKAKKDKKEEKEEGEEKEKDKKKKFKKIGNENGYHLVLRNLISKEQDTFKFVTNYSFAKKGKRFTFSTSGDDKNFKAGVYVLNLENNLLTQIHEVNKAKYYQLNFSETGKNIAFIVDEDTTKVQIRPNKLYTWLEGRNTAKKQLEENNAPTGYHVSSDGKISFSKDETRLYFGLATTPIIKDTTLIDDEIVNVEVWTYNEPRLYTVQELEVKDDIKKSYVTTLDLKNNKGVVQISNLEFPDAELGNEGNSMHALVSTPLPYELESQWTGRRAKDYAVVDIKTGKKKVVLKKIIGRVRLSPAGKYAYGYNVADSTWFTLSVATNKYTKLTDGKVFYNELNDSPRNPNSYGAAGWSKNDEFLIIYDRYDIWKFSPDGKLNERLTKGRETTTSYRYLKLDIDERYLDLNKKWLLKSFNETDKNSGYVELNAKNKIYKQLLEGPYNFSNPKKAQLSNEVIYTRESFKEFPNILCSDLNFKNQITLSDANPQQKDYNWGTIESVSWTSLDGKELNGMLVKPEDFDPNKKYPMIVNFYEKSSNGLHRHRAPAPGRSTINYSFYASRGYLIFNPDIYYRIGYPGESAYNCVIPGVTSLIEKGFVDKNNIGVQGHSWGGYQIAYLVTKTDIFKAAESGAPVPNMISAYGGIRWWTGLSRQFQYEHTQSRIGGTPWEYPSRYIENSPIFNMDKINTPLLIMHNDADGHVPWYQGIEFFMSLRRLGKPSWFLNYNGEPHWPLKMQNRKDFNIRMAQFFDYYLKGASKPVWMERGVPAIEKGINQGYELIPK